MLSSTNTSMFIFIDIMKSFTKNVFYYFGRFLSEKISRGCTISFSIIIIIPRKLFGYGDSTRI